MNPEFGSRTLAFPIVFSAKKTKINREWANRALEIVL